MAQVTYSRADGRAWVESVLAAQAQEITELEKWLGANAVNAARTAHGRKNYELCADLITRIRERGKVVTNQLEQLKLSFRSVIAQEIIKYRGVADARAVDGFAAAISAHLARYGEKLAGLRALSHDVEAVEAAIKADATDVVALAYERGRVEFEGD
jgi:hypothetical protein